MSEPRTAPTSASPQARRYGSVEDHRKSPVSIIETPRTVPRIVGAISAASGSPCAHTTGGDGDHLSAPGYASHAPSLGLKRVGRRCAGHQLRPPLPALSEHSLLGTVPTPRNQVTIRASARTSLPYRGGLVWPFSLLPQQVAWPCWLRAQLWNVPAVMVVWRPVGASVCRMVLLPRHRMVPPGPTSSQPETDSPPSQQVNSPIGSADVRLRIIHRLQEYVREMPCTTCSAGKLASVRI